MFAHAQSRPIGVREAIGQESRSERPALGYFDAAQYRIPLASMSPIVSSLCCIFLFRFKVRAQMFIAHIPSGYVFSTMLVERVRNLRASASAVITSGVLGALAPDFDMAYFYFFDHRQTHHHKYFSHWPIVWLTLLAASAVWLRLSRSSKASLLALVFCAGCMLHLVLDSLVGDIWWFAPFVDRPFAMFVVPAIFEPWWLNFILHWSFGLELAICLWAGFIYRRRRSAKRAHSADDRQAR